MKKPLAVAVILLFFSVSVIPSTGTADVKQITMPTAKGDTLYVGGNGTGNYSTIQAAIDNASDGDTVFVYDDSSPYYEHNITADKSINLVGENRDTTVIDGSGNIEDVVYVSSDWVAISGFTITNGGIRGIVIVSNYNAITDNNIISNIVYGMVILHSSSNNITGNKISNNQAGIALSDSSNNIITGNIISNSWGSGISLGHSSNNTITDNNISSNGWGGIAIGYSNNTLIIHNKISDNEIGINLVHSNNNTIMGNNFSSNDYNSMSLLDSSNNNIIYHNNFLNSMSVPLDKCNNFWDNDYPSGGNYFDDYIGVDNNGDGIGDTPYHIIGGDNEDRYPLMEPYGMTELSLNFRSGLFKLSGGIKNIGNNTAFNVQWNITIEGGFVLLGKESSGAIPKPLLPGEETTVCSKLFFGFGRIMITVAAWADNAPYVSESISGILFLFFIKINPGGGI